MRIRTPVQNFIIDVASLVALVLLVATGFLMRYTLPPGQGHGRTVLGLSRHDWGAVHFWISIALLALLVVHLLLHWKWITTMIKGRTASTSRRRITISVVGIIVLLLLVLAPFLVPVGSRSPSSRGDAHEVQEAGEAPPSVVVPDGSGRRAGRRGAG